jgi:fructosamine-3-kinase
LAQLGRGEPRGLVRVGGGCIADAAIATFADGTRVFVKRLAGKPDMFEREAEGLRALAAARAIRIPEVLAVSKDTLVLELIEEAPRKQGFFKSFGRAFARLHRHRGRACGFPHDNYIGATRQRNDPLDGDWEHIVDREGEKWPEFFLERRLWFQVRLAETAGYGPELGRLLGVAEALIMDLLHGATEAPSILHGDLWGGNYIVDERGEACLIDPAAYYGHREADLAMTRLFGGFTSEFYAAYEEVMPLSAGHAERLPLYQLYHVLNHLNLFGGGYFDQSKRILQRYSG